MRLNTYQKEQMFDPSTGLEYAQPTEKYLRNAMIYMICALTYDNHVRIPRVNASDPAFTTLYTSLNGRAPRRPSLSCRNVVVTLECTKAEAEALTREAYAQIDKHNALKKNKDDQKARNDFKVDYALLAEAFNIPTDFPLAIRED